MQTKVRVFRLLHCKGRFAHQYLRPGGATAPQNKFSHMSAKCCVKLCPCNVATFETGRTISKTTAGISNSQFLVVATCENEGQTVCAVRGPKCSGGFADNLNLGRKIARLLPAEPACDNEDKN